MSLVAHLRAAVDVEAHVVVSEIRASQVQLASELDLSQGRVDPWREEHDVGVVEEVHGGETAGEDVDHTHHDEATVNVVVLVVRPVVAGPTGGPARRGEGGVAEESAELGLSAFVLRAVVDGALVFLVQGVASRESGIEFRRGGTRGNQFDLKGVSRGR